MRGYSPHAPMTGPTEAHQQVLFSLFIEYALCLNISIQCPQCLQRGGQTEQFVKPLALIRFEIRPLHHDQMAVAKQRFRVPALLLKLAGSGFLAFARTTAPCKASISSPERASIRTAEASPTSLLSSGGSADQYSRRGDKVRAYFVNPRCKGGCDDHGHSGKQDVPVTPRKRIGSEYRKEVKDGREDGAEVSCRGSVRQAAARVEILFTQQDTTSPTSNFGR